MILVKKSEFAEIAKITKPAVSKLVRVGRIPVTDDGRIDIGSDICREYLAKKGISVDEPSEPDPLSVSDSLGTGKSQPSGRSSMFGDTDGPGAPDLAVSSSRDSAPKTGKTVSDVMSRRKLETEKLQAEILYKKLQNAQISGRVVSRRVMEELVWDRVETFLRRLQSEGAQTIGKALHQLGCAGGTREEFIQVIKSELTSYILPLKDTVRDSTGFKANG